MFLLLVGLYISNGDRIGTQNKFVGKVPADILQTVTGIVFAEAEIDD